MLSPFKLHVLSITAEVITNFLLSDAPEHEKEEIINKAAETQAADPEFWVELKKYITDARHKYAEKETTANNAASNAIAKMMKP